MSDRRCSFLSALAERPIHPQITSGTEGDAHLLRLMRQVMVARVAVSDDALSLAITDRNGRGGILASTMTIAAGAEALALLDLITGDLMVRVLDADASVMAATGWDRPAAPQDDAPIARSPRAMIVDAAASAKDILVLSQIVKAAITFLNKPLILRGRHCHFRNRGVAYEDASRESH